MCFFSLAHSLALSLSLSSTNTQFIMDIKFIHLRKNIELKPAFASLFLMIMAFRCTSFCVSLSQRCSANISLNWMISHWTRHNHTQHGQNNGVIGYWMSWAANDIYVYTHIPVFRICFVVVLCVRFFFVVIFFFRLDSAMNGI